MSESDRERYREARAAGIAQHGDNVMLNTPCHAFLLWLPFMIVHEAGRTSMGNSLSTGRVGRAGSAPTA